ncbi:unnamed protein product [Effrenium voratum]|nr:unnamed protein product [Effrenium voratum]
MGKLMHFTRCLGAVLRKNLTLKPLGERSRQWASVLLELLLPVALMGLLIWIRSEVHKEDIPAASYVDSPENNPTWFPAHAIDVEQIPGLPPAVKEQLAQLCRSGSALCPEIFADSWGLRKEHYTGSALDGLLPVHMAERNLRLGIVGSAGRGLYDFIASLPGYSSLTRFFESQDSYDSYLSSRDYGFTDQTPGPRASRKEFEGETPTYSCLVRWLYSLPPIATLLGGKSYGAACKGDWDILIHLNTSGPSTSTADIQGGTDINTKLIPEVNKLNKGLQMSTSKIFWSGGLDRSLGLALPSGGLLDLQSLVYAWIFNSTGAYELPEPQALSSCGCVDPQGQATEDLLQCNSSALFGVALRSLTPAWVGAGGGCLGRLSSLLPVSVREVPFPTPAYTQESRESALRESRQADPFAKFVESVFGLFFVLVFIWPLTRIMKSLVEDKEARINEVMKMMGMPAEAITFGWYITYGLLWLIPAALMTLICWNSVFQHSDKFLVFLFFWLFGLCAAQFNGGLATDQMDLQVVTLCSLIAVFFSKAKTASVVGALLFFLLYFPYLRLDGLTELAWQKMLASLSPPVALSIGVGLIAQFESSGEGVRWSNLDESLDNSSMAQCLVMLLVDTGLFAVLAWYLDKVLVLGFGTRQPWWFPCSKHYWSPETTISQEELQDVEQGFDDLSPPNSRYEAIPESMAAQRSVLVRDLCKDFHTADGKILRAPSEVTLNLYSGQIFCLLGHNGAGKTTTINMLSGMLPVSSGDALVYGKSVRRDMAQIRKMLGVCPQHDVIWSELTVREHLEFFSKAKGVSPELLPAEVDALIQEVSLQEKEHALAGTLSGGQKRRLSAAVALCGGSQVAGVFLDDTWMHRAFAASVSREESPEERSCLLSRLLFFWATPVFWRGYRNGRTDLQDLPPLPRRDRPFALAEEVAFLAEPAESKAMPWLMRKIFKVTRPVMIQACVCQTLLTICSFLQPILLHGLLEILSLPKDQRQQGLPEVMAYSLGLAGAVMGQWIFAEAAWTLFVRADLQAQVLLSHLVYRKSLFLRLDECPYTVGDLQNHFATDCTKPVLCFLHASHCSIVLALASIGVVCWHLTELTGSAGPVGMLVFVVAAPLQLILTQRIKRASKRTQECRDVRGRLCNEFLGAMRVVKCFTLEQVALGLLGVARDAELEAQWMKRKVFPISNCLGSTVSLFATIVSFLWLELVLDRPVDAAIAFTVLSWANLLKDNIMQLPNQVASILDAYVGITRVQQLLCCEASNGAWLQDSGYALDVVPTQDADFILQDCDLGWPVSEEEHGFRGARQISLKVQPGELLLVSGPIGAGKSALLEGLTGTKPVQGGSCWRRGRSTAYVAQRPWLLNGTLLENILFGQSFNQQKLTETLESCALAQDLNSLPSGLDTLVGEEGVQLSGGQKQRVSLARAVYSGAQVVLMDDVLSALDAHVGHHVFEEVICKALSGRTRILVTHQVQYWSHPAVSRVLRLDAFGRCEFLGAFDGQNAAAAKAAEEEAAVEAVVEEEEKAPESGDPSRPSAVSSRQAASVELRRAGRILREDLMAYAKACGGLAGVFSIASLMVVYYGSQLASSLQLAFWSNANVQAEDSGQPEARDVSRRYLVQYLLLCLLTGASCFSFFFGIQLVALRGSKRMHDSFMKGLIYTHLRFFDVTPTGRALNRCLKDMATVDDRMPAAFRELFQSFMNVVISMLILGLFAWQALVVVPPFSVLYWMILTVYRWPARDLRRLEGVSRSPGMSHFADSVKGARTIRAFGHEARFLERNLTLLGENQLTTYWFWVAQAWVSCFQAGENIRVIGSRSAIVPKDPKTQRPNHSQAKSTPLGGVGKLKTPTKGCSGKGKPRGLTGHFFGGWGEKTQRSVKAVFRAQ